jgi:hypothetical protein
MLLGGKLTDGKRRPTSAGNGMGSAGTQSDGAKQVRIAKGDMLIIPAGTPPPLDDGRRVHGLHGCPHRC